MLIGLPLSRWLDWNASVYWNPGLLEGVAWHFHQLWLPHRLWDTALIVDTGAVYNVFPPLVSIVGYFMTITGPPADDAIYRWVPFFVFGLPLPFVGYYAFWRRTRSEFWAAVLMLAWFAGTAVFPCVECTRRGLVHHVYQVLSQVGLLLLSCELLAEPSRRRWWLALIGLLIAVWSRQLTAAYAIAFLILVWRDAQAKPMELQPTKKRWGPIVQVCLGLAVIAAVPMGLNWAKFGNPLDTGYKLIYVGRDSDIAQDVEKHGIFSTAYVGRNAYYLNLALPWKMEEPDGRIVWSPSQHGASIWFTTPLLAMVLIGIRAWWREPAARWLMFCTVPIILGILFYHNTGYVNTGYCRFPLDFIPVWLMVAAPWLIQGRRRWATLACAVWSITYFTLLVQLRVAPYY